jgi:hypothetical protein
MPAAPWSVAAGSGMRSSVIDQDTDGKREAAERHRVVVSPRKYRTMSELRMEPRRFLGSLVVPGRTRTCNQTVMSSKLQSQTASNFQMRRAQTQHQTWSPPPCWQRIALELL